MFTGASLMFHILWQFPKISVGLVSRQLWHLRKRVAVPPYFCLTVTNTTTGVPNSTYLAPTFPYAIWIRAASARRYRSMTGIF